VKTLASLYPIYSSKSNVMTDLNKYADFMRGEALNEGNFTNILR